MIYKLWYIICYTICRIGLFLYHPVFIVKGRENVQQNGKAVICVNHSGLADPIWVVFALKLRQLPRIMAKKEVMSIPVVGPALRYFGVFGVDREGTDVNAIKTGLKCLRDENKLLIFPEGTRIKNGKKSEPKRGAALLAARTDSPILPVYLSTRRIPFGPIRCVIGEPYKISCAGAKPTEEELDAAAKEMMRKIYALGESR